MLHVDQVFTVMQFNVATLLVEPVGTNRSYAIDGVHESTEFNGNVNFTKTDVGILVEAQFGATASLECARCVGFYTENLKIRFEEEYLPERDITSGVLRETNEESYWINPNHILDIQPAIAEYTALEIPLKPLCSSKCLGLCTTCGTNLNSSGCECEANSGHPAFVALREKWASQSATKSNSSNSH
ncbi:MAG: DUF177 domain-containing protein [SAR202 cluster bacterium]|nr:DUF177 domain-containing protein [SAR202 cluster bacterium]|tara:strand:+ start:5867 stop:6424 length:558 start_codon:yes stop_codon:yes gene_type:complete